MGFADSLQRKRPQSRCLRYLLLNRALHSQPGKLQLPQQIWQLTFFSSPLNPSSVLKNHEASCVRKAFCGTGSEDKSTKLTEQQRHGQHPRHRLQLPSQSLPEGFGYPNNCHAHFCLLHQKIGGRKYEIPKSTEFITTSFLHLEVAADKKRCSLFCFSHHVAAPANSAPACSRSPQPCLLLLHRGGHAEPGAHRTDVPPKPWPWVSSASTENKDQDSCALTFFNIQYQHVGVLL